MQLYSYYRSSAAYRVRIALAFKQLKAEIIAVNLADKAHLSEDYRAINPQQRVPFLIDGEVRIGQSSAILDYLEERYPSPALYPKDIKARAVVRNMMQIVCADMHPLNNLSTLTRLKQQFNADENQVLAWYHHWLSEGFQALEALLAQHSNGRFCFGDAFSFADVCLIPQLYNARRFNFDLSIYKTILAVDEHCQSLDYVASADPARQIDSKP